MLKGASAVYERDGTSKKQLEAAARDRARLVRKIGKLILEVDVWRKSKEQGL